MTASLYHGIPLTASFTAICLFRVYCVLLRPDIEALLTGPQKVVPNEAFFRLLVAVHQLDNLAIQWCGGKIGQLLQPPTLSIQRAHSHAAFACSATHYSPPHPAARPISLAAHPATPAMFGSLFAATAFCGHLLALP